MIPTRTDPGPAALEDQGIPAPLSRFAKFLALSPFWRGQFVVAWMTLPAIWLGVRILGIRRVMLWADGARYRRSEPDSYDAGRTAWIVHAAARYAPCPVTCLTRSLLLHAMLVRAGLPSQLRLGVSPAGAELRAHAWVECAGAPVGEDPVLLANYLPFDRLPA